MKPGQAGIAQYRISIGKTDEEIDWALVSERRLRCRPVALLHHRVGGERQQQRRGHQDEGDTITFATSAFGCACTGIAPAAAASLKS
jgi:hypothetical protein